MVVRMQSTKRRGKRARRATAACETLSGAAAVGRRWAERQVLAMIRFGVDPEGPWTGTMAEAEWLFIADKQADRRFCLAALALDAARERWNELVGRSARSARHAA
jgi:hypothetical protein